MEDYDARFGGIARLVGVEGLSRLRRARVCVIGVGGVGSWAVEALARTGIGALTMVDLDDVCISNVNRQLPAISGHFGRPKVEVLAERVRAIQPDCHINAHRAFFTAGTADEILALPNDYIVDAIDRPEYKSLLAIKCKERNLPLLMVGAAGGRRDPTKIRVMDLMEANHDRLLAEVRRRLRNRPELFPAGKLTGVRTVFSIERPVFPQADGTVCEVRAAGRDLRLDCNSGYGTAAFVTGAFGLAAAAHVVERLSSP